MMKCYSAVAGIAELWRYPVKSMAGEALSEASITPVGIEGDRRYALVDSAPNRAGKLLTGRQLDRLLAFRPTLASGSLEVEAPDGRRLNLDQARASLEELAGRTFAIREAAGDNYDDSHLLLVNLVSLAGLEAVHGSALDRRRFRANLYLEGMAADEEYGWRGRRLSAGTAVLEGVKMCERCVMITLDPDDQVQEPSILRTLTRTRATLMGLYCRVLEPGTVRIDDQVEPA